eukprot:TRINITY_DN9490_c0_g2_i6.p1 TRINITY_DN9490_c0_g2~~TRINITY_DN9490_c0_g2_i6.p1  ORF type:complete len:494 (+),score=92.89 TRINITY_DN9490_c0_g2_i6:1-1482(+)
MALQIKSSVYAVLSLWLCHASATLPYQPSGQIVPKSALTIKESHFSVGAETMDRNYTYFDSWKRYLGPLGVKHARIQLGWAHCEPAKGVYNFTWLDDIIDGMVAQGVTPWAEFSYGNQVYGVGGGNAEVNSPIPFGTEAEAGWTAWVNTVLDRYGDKINEWEMWNEPDIQQKRIPGHMDPIDYAYLIVNTSKLVLAKYPNASIYAQIAGSTSYLNETLATIKTRNPALLEVIDVTYHPYSYNPDDSYNHDGKVEQILDVVRAYSPNMRILQGENGAPSTYGRYGALGDYNWTEFSQAKWALRRLIGDAGYTGQEGGISTSYFSIADMCYTTSPLLGKEDTNTKGLLLTNCSDPAKSIIRPKLAYHAVQHLTSTFSSNTEVNPAINVTVDTAKRYATRAFTHGDTGVDFVAVWFSDQTPAEWVLENCTSCLQSVTLTNANIGPGPYMFADLVSGNLYDVPADQVTKEDGYVVVSDYPVYDGPVVFGSVSLWNSG